MLIKCSNLLLAGQRHHFLLIAGVQNGFASAGDHGHGGEDEPKLEKQPDYYRFKIKMKKTTDINCWTGLVPIHMPMRIHGQN